MKISRKSFSALPLTVIRQKHLIHNVPWDYLVILDACRYDSFRNNYRKHLKGTLYKCYSEADGTIYWLKRTWPDYYNIHYYSGNPTIQKGLGYRIKDWSTLDHFENVIEVWRESSICALPHQMREAVERDRPQKAIIHYNQPHFPYFGETTFTFPDDIRTAGRFRWIDTNKLQPMVKKGYRENLNLALASVARLRESFPEKIIIVTSDHGEWLGEYDQWFHTDANLNDPILRTVPWFITEP